MRLDTIAEPPIAQYRRAYAVRRGSSIHPSCHAMNPTIRCLAALLLASTPVCVAYVQLTAGTVRPNGGAAFGLIAIGGTPRLIPTAPATELPVAAAGEGRPKARGAYEMMIGVDESGVTGFTVRLNGVDREPREVR